MFSLKSITVLLAASGIAIAAPVAVNNNAVASVDKSFASRPFDALVPRQEVCPNDEAGAWPFELINKWRAAYGLSQLAFDMTLHQNSLKTVNDCGGAVYQHELNPGSYGQVLAFGYKTPQSGRDTDGMTPFELTLVGGWLCERPEASQLGGNCGTYSSLAHMDPSGQTGHVDIILNPAYTKVGCGFAQDMAKSADDPLNGMWGCDFGY